ncbi:chaplin [Streptomyces sp. NPDC052236]|uniref:chaplin n=1 Tax=Streptomyces sp. NPDC052236 TaxID=3365686 RepID=UPI0037D93863
MKNLKRAAALTMVAGSLVAAGAGVASATSGTGAEAHGAAVKSPGIASGNLVQAPVHVPVNVSGNTVNVVGALNPTFDNAAYTD